MANALDLTHADLEAEHHGLVLSGTTSPTDAQVDAMVDRYAREELNMVSGWGRSTPTSAPSPLYDALRSIVIYRALAQLISSRDRATSPLVERYDKLVAESRERLRKYPQDAGSDRPTGENAPGIHASHVSSATREEEIAASRESRGASARVYRMLARGQR